MGFGLTMVVEGCLGCARWGKRVCAMRIMEDVMILGNGKLVVDNGLEGAVAALE